MSDGTYTSNTYTYILLNPAYLPATITSTGGVTAASGNAVVAAPDYSFILINYGSVEAARGAGIDFGDGGAITNAFRGMIEGYTFGIEILGSPGGSVWNDGTIDAVGSSGVGIDLAVLATVTNLAAGTIEGSICGIDALDSGGTVANAGTIDAGGITGVGIDLADGGVVTNQAGGYIHGGTIGIEIDGAVGTVFDYGTISGGRYSIDFLAAGGALYLKPGSVLIGDAYGDGGKLFLRGGTSASSTISGLGATGTLSGAIIGTVSGFGYYVVSGGGVFLAGQNTLGSDQRMVLAAYLGITGTLENAGTIQNFDGNSNRPKYTLHIEPGGDLINDASGLIRNYTDGNIFGGTITNFGTIAGNGTLVEAGIHFRNGELINETGGRIIGWFEGAKIGYATLLNAGTIEATLTSLHNSAVNASHSTIVNETGGVINSFWAGIYDATSETTQSTVIINEQGAIISGGSFGIFAKYAGVTVINYGTIEGGDAIVFEGAGDLLVEPGSDFVGPVGGGELLELVAGSGTFTGLGRDMQVTGSETGDFLDFGIYEIEGGGTWTLTGYNAVASGCLMTGDATFIVDGTLVDAGTLTVAGPIEIGTASTLDVKAAISSGTVAFAGSGGDLKLEVTAGVSLALSGFGGGDRIDFTGVAYDTGAMSATYAAGAFELLDHGTLAAKVAFTGLAGDRFLVSADILGGTKVELVCYLRGTRILTDRGEVAIERLAVGDLVVTVSGRGRRLKPIRWIGRRRIGARKAGLPGAVHPVRIAAGAFADDLPRRDLLVSPQHAIFAAGVLIPARRLVNGRSVTRDRGFRSLEYFHIELDAHDVILAEGLPAETYVDCGNRQFFGNAGKTVALHGLPDRRAPAARLCAPFRERGPEVLAVRRHLIDRALGSQTAPTATQAGGRAA